MWYIEAIGIVGTLAILVSMCFKTSSYKATLWLRILNLVGSVLFVVYGALLPALSTAILNGVLIFVNGFHIVLLVKENKKATSSKEENQEPEQK